MQFHYLFSIHPFSMKCLVYIQQLRKMFLLLTSTIVSSLGAKFFSTSSFNRRSITGFNNLKMKQNKKH